MIDMQQSELTVINFYKIILQTGRILHKNRSLTHREYCLRTDVNKTTNQIEMGLLAYFEHVEALPTKYVLSAICRYLIL